VSNQKISGSGFHHVAIRTYNFENSVRFYTEALGFVQKIIWGEAPTRGIMLDTGDGNYLEIFEREGEPAETTGEPNILHFALRCDDCEAATELARAAGAKITLEPTVPAAFTGLGLKTKISFLQGPDGEIVEFFESSDL